MDFDGKKLKELRKKHKLSLDKLALLTSSSKSYIWELENKKHLEPSGKKIYLFAQALGVPMECFYGGKPDALKETLGTLISWMAQSYNSPISIKEAETLIKMLQGEEK